MGDCCALWLKGNTVSAIQPPFLPSLLHLISTKWVRSTPPPPILMTKEMTFIRSVQMSTRVIKRKKKSPVRHRATYSCGCFESNEARSETAAAQPIGCWVESSLLAD